MVEQLMQQYIVRHMLTWRGFLEDTRRMLTAHAAFTPSDHQVLAGFAAQLTAYLTHDRDASGFHAGITWRDRIADFRDHLPPKELVAVACLYPAAIAPITRNQPSRPLLSALSHTSRSFNAEKQEQAAKWIAWALDLLEAASLLSPSQCQELLGSDIPAEPLAALMVVAGALAQIVAPALPPHNAMRSLTAQEGQKLGNLAVCLLERGTCAGLEIGAEILLDLACLVPDSLASLHNRLAVFPHLRGAIFYQAPSPVADLLREHIANPDRLLKALVWTADPSVPRELHEMRRNHRSLPGLLVAPYQYSLEGGWELTANGGRRELCYDTAYELIDYEEPSDTGCKRTLAVATPSRESCGLCGYRLTNLLELDLANPRFAFLNLPGRRLVVPTCPTCWGWTYARTDSKGNASWLPDSSRFNDGDGDRVAWPENPLQLGPAARTPIQSLAREGSYLGGHPAWINDAEYPPCPGCGQTMMMLAHISLMPLGGDGIIYAFLCPDCRITATTPRCT